MAKTRELSTNKKLIINLSASFISYIVTFGISFFLSPYIIRTVGVEAYGFVGLANNFVSYASLITVALNALAGRFISIKIFEKDYEAANKYYTSVFLANAFLSAILFIVALFTWLFLEKLIKIPDNIFWDVKILFAVLFFNCIISTTSSVFGISTFAENRLYLASIRSIESSVARAIVLLLMYSFMPPKVYYLGITSFLMLIYCVLYNFYYDKKLTPFLKIRLRYFDFNAVKELVASGIWSLVTRLGQILIDGLDLLITNIFIDAVAMGVLSLAKTVPGVISSIVGTLVGAFSPNFTKLYAEQRFDELKNAIKQSMKIMGIICNIPIIILIVCGEKFFALWQPTQDAKQLQILSLLTVGCLIFSGGINCIYNIFTVVNKLKLNALVVVFSGLLSTAIVFIVLKTTNWGVYAVAGVSSVVSFFRNVLFTAPYGAKCIGYKWYTFYPDVFKPAVFVLIAVLPGYLIDSFLIVNTNWISLIIETAFVVLLSMVIGWFIILKKNERDLVIGIVKDKVISKIKGTR